MKDPPSSSSLPPPQQQQQPKEGLEHGWCWDFEGGFQGAEGAFPFLAVNEEFPPSRVSSQRVSLPSVFLEEKFSLEENPADRGLAGMSFISLYAENNKTAVGSWVPSLSSLRGVGLDLSGRTLN